MTRAKQMKRFAWLAGALFLTLGLSACYTAEDPATYNCSDKERDCPDGYTCAPDTWTCVKDGTQLDSRVDGPVPDQGKDVTADKGKDTATDKGKDVGIDLTDGPMPDKPIPDQGIPVTPKWVTIKAGTFQMGSPTTEKCRQVGLAKETQHRVTLTNSFVIQDVEVTQGQFKALMNYNPSKFTTCGTDCPVEQVSWHEAAAYCNALSKKQGIESCYTCTGSGTKVTCQVSSSYSKTRIYHCPGYRLPTEAEWEYAYRAGTTTAFYNGTVVATSCGSADSNLDKIGWYKLNSKNTSHPVGKKQANAWSLYDMAGNIEEWVNDCYQADLGSTTVTDPTGPSSCGTGRVIRGGSWPTSNVGRMRAAFRNSIKATDTWNYAGFRPVRTLISPKWVTVKAGTFMMGSPSTEMCRHTHESAHKVTLTNDFQIQNTEVTQGQFLTVMGYSPSTFSKCGTTCPVETITWHEAAAYCNKLSVLNNLKPCYSCSGSKNKVVCKETPETQKDGIYYCAGYRLPTEAEWEYAYRALTISAFYNGGITNCTGADANADKVGWYSNNSSKSTHPAGRKTPNSWGLYDLPGNVYEWCHDWGLANYSGLQSTNPVGSGTYRVLRGGSWYHPPNNMRAARRNYVSPLTGNQYFGFRPVRTILPKPVAYWPLDEGTGTKAKDSSGNKYDGTVSSATWINGVKGKGLLFTGKGYVSTPFIPGYGPKDSFSMAAWFKTTTKSKSTSIFGLEMSKSSEIQVGLDTSGIVRFNLNDGSAGGDAKSSKTFADNTWHHIVAVRDGSAKKLFIYVDGVQVASSLDKSTGKINTTAKIPLSIGAVNQVKQHEKLFAGSIDEPRVYNTALTASQAKFLYASTSPTCGDGVISGNEECDGKNLGGKKCSSLGWTGTTGTLTCNSKCRFRQLGCLGSGVVAYYPLDSASLTTKTIKDASGKITTPGTNNGAASVAASRSYTSHFRSTESMY